MAEVIEHSAIVREVKGEKILVQVFVENSSCKNCKIKSSCAVAKMNNKIIEVQKPQDKKVEEGEKIKVYFSEETGLKAVFLGYILPFIILIITLAIATHYTENEGKAGLIALGSMFLYYLSLYLFRKKITETFSLKVNK